jgi:gamma-glutamyltranspeptidase/glutathione hydrolase
MVRARELKGTRRAGALALGGALLLAAGVAGAGATGSHGMVVASQADAARAGLAMLERGGNAVDAAVATAFALAVTQPFSAGLGGGAFVLVRAADGEVAAIDARETAPAAADRDMYVRPGVAPDASLKGALAVATPGFVRGMALAQERYGRLSWAQVLAPAIRLADEGFEIGPYHARMLGRMRALGLPKFFPETGWIQFPRAGTEARPGWRLRQKDLATTLRTLAEQGPDAFYTGEIARRIAAEMERRRGLLTAEDLAGYRPQPRPAVVGRYRDLEVVSFPPPSSGGAVLVEMLNILEGFDLASLGPEDPSTAHRVVEAMKLAFADRAFWFGDPDFVEVPLAELTSKQYAAKQRERFSTPWYRKSPLHWGDAERAIEVKGPGIPPRDSGTTHLSTADAEGNAVALTMTINTPFGSGITVAGTGIVLNNEMDDFSKAPGRPNVYGLVDERGANAVAPNKRPLSSMTPTILVKDGKLFMVTGSPGGPRIITTTLLTILDVVDFGMSVQEAVAAPRYHHQWLPDHVSVEPGISAALVEGLEERGHEVERSEHTWSSAQAIVVDPETGLQHGGSDPRGDGAALGFGPRRGGPPGGGHL